MVDMDTLVSLCKRRGFVFQSSEIYGGLGSAWDYGPLGVELKRNIRNLWWRDVVHLRRDVVGLEAAVLMHPRVWVASGHAAEPSATHGRLQELQAALPGRPHRRSGLDALLRGQEGQQVRVAAGEAVQRTAAPGGRLCPECGKGELTEPRQFNLMLKTFLGSVEEEGRVAYLRPETTQGMFVNFENVAQSMRRKLPFGIAQVGG